MWYVRDGEITMLFLYVQPGAKTTEIAGLHDDALKIRLNAPPVDGQANDRLQKYLAQRFGVPLRQVRLVRGEKNRRKVFEITGSDVEPESLILND
jgi:uncharacterized protein